MNKKDLLKNFRDYSPEQIAEAIRAGVISSYELQHETEGAYTPLLKRQVKAILEKKMEQPVAEVNQQSTTNIAEAYSSNPENSIIEPKSEVSMSQIPSFDTSSSEFSNIEETNTSASTTTDEVNNNAKPSMFSHPFSFYGRIRRTEYGISMIIGFVINIVLNAILSSAEQNSSGSATSIIVLYFILLLFYIWFALAQGAKRCHDRGNSGFYQLIPFYSLWMLFAVGDSKPNEYGVCPK